MSHKRCRAFGAAPTAVHQPGPRSSSCTSGRTGAPLPAGWQACSCGAAAHATPAPGVAPVQCQPPRLSQDGRRLPALEGVSPVLAHRLLRQAGAICACCSLRSSLALPVRLHAAGLTGRQAGRQAALPGPTARGAAHTLAGSMCSVWQGPGVAAVPGDACALGQALHAGHSGTPAQARVHLSVRAQACSRPSSQSQCLPCISGASPGSSTCRDISCSSSGPVRLSGCSSSCCCRLTETGKAALQAGQVRFAQVGCRPQPWQRCPGLRPSAVMARRSRLCQALSCSCLHRVLLPACACGRHECSWQQQSAGHPRCRVPA